MNYHVLRIKNKEFGNVEVVMDKIKAFIFEAELTDGRSSEKRI